MGFSIGKKLAGGFGIVLLLSVITGGIVLVTMARVNEQFAFVAEHDTPVIANARQLTKLVAGMEAGQRGFCITQQDKFLEPYTQAVSEFSSLMKEEKDLVSDDPSQLKALESIESLLQEWQEKAARPEIEMARKTAQGTVDADFFAELIAKGVGQGIVDELETLADSMMLKFRAAGSVNGELLAAQASKAMVARQSAKRGFLITGREEFLEPYKSGRTEFDAAIAGLKALVGNAYDRAGTASDLDELDKLGEKWLKESGEAQTELRRQVDSGEKTLKDLQDALTQGLGKDTLDKMRAIVGRLESRFAKAENEGALRSLVQTAKGMVDQETGQWAFLITGKEQFLASYKAGQELFKESIEELRKLNSDAYDVEAMKSDIAKLQELASNWDNEAGEAQIAAREEMNKHPETLKDVAALLQAGTGTSIIDKIRATFDGFISAEMKRRADRYAEARAATTAARNLTCILTLSSVVIGCFVAVVIGRRVTSPIRELVRAAERVGEGDLGVEARVNSHDETGVLADAFNRMVANLRTMAGQAREATSSITASTAQILTATSEQAASVSQQVASVSEAGSTVAEVRQTAEQSADRATLVSKSSQECLESADEGLRSVQEMVASTNSIKEQVGSIAETILTLNEQMQQIGDIISTVNDIADQSNLLALNASIEAARAGEAGKGFAVVADEVSSLAEQSQQATAQVRDILGQIQKGANGAVMVTEEGIKRAEAGVELAQGAGEAIRSINEQVRRMSLAAQQIAASAQQQLAGMDQIGAAMDSISKGSEQTQAGAEQTEKTAQSLNALAEQLSGVVAQYKMS